MMTRGPTIKCTGTLKKLDVNRVLLILSKKRNYK